MATPQVVEYHSIAYCTSLPSCSVILTEKIDGSNIGIGFVDGALRIQSRRVIIDKNTKNFGLNAIVDKLIEKTTQLKDILKHDNFLVYGEIFGAKNFKRMCYDDSETSRKAFNSDLVFFRAFDLYDVKKETFWRYSDAIRLFEQVGLPYVPILRDVAFKRFADLYAIAEFYKSAYSVKSVEGFVLKKDEAEKKHDRVILKVIRKEFDFRKSKKYANEQRFLSAYSKIGNDPEKIKREMIDDLVEELSSGLKIEMTNQVEKYFKDHYDRLAQKYSIAEAAEETTDDPEQEKRLIEETLKKEYEERDKRLREERLIKEHMALKNELPELPKKMQCVTLNSSVPGNIYKYFYGKVLKVGDPSENEKLLEDDKKG